MEGDGGEPGLGASVWPERSARESRNLPLREGTAGARGRSRLSNVAVEVSRDYFNAAVAIPDAQSRLPKYATPSPAAPAVDPPESEQAGPMDLTSFGKRDGCSTREICDVQINPRRSALYGSSRGQCGTDGAVQCPVVPPVAVAAPRPAVVHVRTRRRRHRRKRAAARSGTSASGSSRSCDHMVVSVVCGDRTAGPSSGQGGLVVAVGAGVGRVRS